MSDASPVRGRRLARPGLARALILAGVGAVMLAACTDGATSTTTASVAPRSLSELLASGGSTQRIAVGDTCLLVEIADTAAERNRGLSNRDHIGSSRPGSSTGQNPTDGMLFVWENDVTAQFWMYRTRIPLTIGWYSFDGTPIDRADMEPCPETVADNCPRYGASKPYRYALEVVEGELSAGGLGACPR